MSIPDWAQDIITRLGRLEGTVKMLVEDMREVKKKLNGVVRNSAQNKGALAAWTAVIAALVSAIVGGAVRLLAR
ncbi:MAG: hypothetical protein DRP82_02370 [Planctomycetota bacterium]|nr:MAG: hypothetical protein DRP82_02370 [Planctomycetota bacterium]